MYGAGGILRYLVSRARRRTLLIDPAICRSVIENLETNLHAALMDNWVAPHVRVYEAEKVSLRLSELGIEKKLPLKYGTKWDVSTRLQKFPEDSTWLGEQDLRYVVKKIEHVIPSLSKNSLHNHDVKPHKKFDSKIMQIFDPIFDYIDKKSDKILEIHAEAFFKDGRNNEIKFTV